MVELSDLANRNTRSPSEFQLQIDYTYILDMYVPWELEQLKKYFYSNID